jgi:hypothetical protein
LTDDEIDDLYQYIRAGARQALEGTAAPSGKPGL